MQKYKNKERNILEDLYFFIAKLTTEQNKEDTSKQKAFPCSWIGKQYC